MSTQIRGNCPCCGRVQAVTKGKMSKHGYTVINGWFNGVCSGNRYAPMQVQREVTDCLVVEVRIDVIKLNKTIANLKSGKTHPLEVLESSSYKAPMIKWEVATEYQKENGVNHMILATESRIRAGIAFADSMEQLVNKKFNTNLIETAEKEVLVSIKKGEKRQEANRVYTCDYVQGARVYWKYEIQGKVFKSWTGSTSWRKMILITNEAI